MFCLFRKKSVKVGCSFKDKFEFCLFSLLRKLSVLCIGECFFLYNITFRYHYIYICLSYDIDFLQKKNQSKIVIFIECK